jgi:membrane-bound serine protease (ClpP class)
MTLGGGFLIFRLLPATGVTRRFVLKTALRREAGFSSHATEKALPQGTTGTALTDLRPAGKIRANGRRLDAVSEGGFIQVGAKVVIVAWRSGEAVVRQQGSHDEEFEGEPTQETNQDEEAS